MRYLLIQIILTFLLLNGIFLNSFCQTKPSKDSNFIHKYERVFDKKPNLDTLINDVIKPIGYVNDYDNLFSTEEQYELDSLLYNFEKKDSIQIILIAFDTSQIGLDEVDIATKAALYGWKVGGNSGKGIVVGISKPYRKMRIQIGTEVQKVLSDDETKKIIDNGFIPEFKKEQYFEGTWSGLQLLMGTLQREKEILK